MVLAAAPNWIIEYPREDERCVDVAVREPGSLVEFDASSDMRVLSATGRSILVKFGRARISKTSCKGKHLKKRCADAKTGTATGWKPMEF